MTLCGEHVSDYDMLEKTLQTFHPANVILQQQYRAKGFTTYSELMQVLLVAEQKNGLVMINHQTRPPESASFPEANVVASGDNNGQGHGLRHRRGKNRNRDCGRGGGRGGGRGRGRRFQPYDLNKRSNENRVDNVTKKQTESFCYICGMKGHWSNNCRTPKHLADMYEQSQKAKKGRNVETNIVSKEVGPSSTTYNDDTYLDVADFLFDT